MVLPGQGLLRNRAEKRVPRAPGRGASEEQRSLTEKHPDPQATLATIQVPLGESGLHPQEERDPWGWLHAPCSAALSWKVLSKLFPLGRRHQEFS